MDGRLGRGTRRKTTAPAGAADAPPAALPQAAAGGDASRRQVIRAAAGLLAAAVWPWGCRQGREPEPVSAARLPRSPGSPSPAASDPRPLPPATPPTIRVLIDRHRDPQPLRIAGEGRWIRLRPSDGSPAIVLPSPVEITLVPAKSGTAAFQVRAASRPPQRLEGESLELALPPGAGGMLSSGGQAWGSLVRLWIRGEGIDAVGEIPIEAYLPGVLAKELYRHWSPAAFEAQAVAARSFAVVEAAHWAKRRHFDVTTGPDTQAWGGFPTAVRPQEAVRATRGVLLAWDGRVVPAYYSSCCGGVPAEASHAIGSSRANEIPPLAGRDDRGLCCEAASTFRWTATLPAAEMHRRLVAWGRSSGQAAVARIGAIRRIDPVLLNRHGRPARFAIEDLSGVRVEAAAERLRAALASGGSPRILSANFEARPRGGDFSFSGRGFGHGVGLCQHGAEAMARRGERWTAILDRYYPQSTLVSAWG